MPIFALKKALVPSLELWDAPRPIFNAIRLAEILAVVVLVPSLFQVWLKLKPKPFPRPSERSRAKPNPTLKPCRGSHPSTKPNPKANSPSGSVYLFGLAHPFLYTPIN